MSYQAFISYKHGGLPLAAKLASALRRYAKPLFTLSPRIFRDEDHLVPNADLPGLIRDALEQSEFLILLASPSAAASKWVRQELLYWCSTLHRSERLIIVLTNGNIREDANNQIDWLKSDALPSELAPFVTSVPLYVDLAWAKEEADLDLVNSDFRRAVNAICARLRGISPNDMSGAEVLQTRRNVLVRNVGVLAVFGFGLLAAGSAVLAERARRDLAMSLQAERQARSAADAARLSEQGARVRAEGAERQAQTERGLALDSARVAEAARQAETLARNRAEEQAKRAESRRLASESTLAERQLDPNDLTLAIAGVEKMPTKEAEWALRTALRRARPSAILETRDANLRGAQLDPQGRWALTQGRSIAIWDVQAERLERELELSASAVAMSADWSSLLAARNGQVVRISLRGGGTRTLRAGESETEVCSALTRNGFRSVTRDSSGRSHVWGDGAEPLATLPPIPAEPTGAWNAEGTAVVLAQGATAWLWRSTSNETAVLQPKVEGASITAVAVGPDLQLAFGDSDGRVHVVYGDTETAIPKTSDSSVSSLAFSHDGTSLAIGTEGGSVYLWRQTWTELRTFDANRRIIYSATFSPSDSELLVSSSDGALTVWPIDLPNDLLSATSAAPALLAELSPDGTLLIVASRTCAATWNMQSRRPIGSPFCPQRAQLLAVGFVNGAASAVIFGGDLARWSLQTHEKTVVFDGAPEQPLAGHLTSTGALTVTDAAGITRVWPPEGARASFQGPLQSPIALSPDGRWLAGVVNGRVQVWNAAGCGTKPVWVSPPLGESASLGFSRDGEALAMGGADGSVRVWRRGTQTLLSMPSGHKAQVRSVAFNLTANLVASASDDATARWWDLNAPNDVTQVQDNKPSGRRFRPDGTVLGEVFGRISSPDQIVAVRFSSDSRRMVTVSAGGLVQAHYRTAQDVLTSARCIRDRGRAKAVCTTQQIWPRASFEPTRPAVLSPCKVVESGKHPP